MKSAIAATPAKIEKARTFLADPETKERLAQDFAVVSDIVRGKAMERFQPLAQKLMGKAIFENNPEVAHLAYNEEPIAAEEE